MSETISANSHHAGAGIQAFPRGAVFLEMRRQLAMPLSAEAGLSPASQLDRIRLADEFLQTARCVGSLACCEGCSQKQDPCPVAFNKRFEVYKTLARRSPGNPELVALQSAWGLAPDGFPAQREEP